MSKPTDECQRCGAMLMICRCEEGPVPPPVGVGDVLKHEIPSWLKAVMYPMGGCNCEELAKEMNALGPSGVEARMDHYVAEVAKSGPSFTPEINASMSRTWIENAIKEARNCAPCAKGADPQ